MPGLIGFATGLLALIFAFVRFKLSAVLLGIGAIVLGIVAQTNTGWIGLVLGLIAMILRFVLSKPERAGQPTPLKPA